MPKVCRKKNDMLLVSELDISRMKMFLSSFSKQFHMLIS